MSEQSDLVRGLRQRLASLTPDQRSALEQAVRRRNALLPPALRDDTPAGAQAAPRRRPRRATSTMDFTLFFFSGDGTGEGPGKYRLLLECAEYADRHGYTAIWVPERHFVDFGGLYPNPSVLAAAIAARTERIGIRAGSVVVPIHHPVRIAEEWSVVDNLSGGRVAISCASGWHPDDFVLAPQRDEDRFARRKDVMFDGMETIQRLWAGETLTLDRPGGERVRVRTLPRPLQPSLPMWVSSQGNVETFARAGQAGANVLTGLVAQRLSDLGEKIAAYRAALREHGHDPAAFKVTAMTHTFLGPSEEKVKETVRQPLIGYLRSFLAQQDNSDSEYAPLTADERDVMLASSFERYFDTIALLGTPDKCETLIEDLVDIGVDEVACLVDFGLDPDTVLGGLDPLTELKDRYREGTGP
ncbi:MupA/Atu3671 family FMN-dependent luciferase-like monooxygenase [Nonomuraea sp. NPDC055795]